MQRTRTPGLRSTLTLMAMLGVLLSMSGCIKMKDVLQINADGSGYWDMTVVLSPKTVQMAKQGQGKSNLPMTKEEAEAKIAGVDGVKLEAYSVVEDAETGQTIKAKYSFTSLAALATSPAAGEGFGWEFKQDGDELVARLPNKGAGPDGEMDDQQFMMMKQMMAGLDIDRTLIMPNKVTKAQDVEKLGPKKVKVQMKITDVSTKDDIKKMSAIKPEIRCSMKGVKIDLPEVDAKEDAGM